VDSLPERKKLCEVIDPELEQYFPRLKDTPYTIESEKTRTYNCIAWAAGVADRWWWPRGSAYYWPIARREETLACFIEAFENLGYQSCNTPDCEDGYENLAIYLDSSGTPTHTARQLETGQWASKSGGLEDIYHSLEGLQESDYGTAEHFMKRPLPRKPRSRRKPTVSSNS